jgi:LPS export ABC transporter protein LptC
VRNILIINRQTRLLYIITISVIVFSLSLSGCTNKMKDVHRFDPLNSPMQVIKDSEIIQSKTGNVQLFLKAPIMNIYDGEDARTEYPEGVFIKFFAEDGSLSTTLSSKYAISYDAKKIMEARNNVIIIDYASGDTTYMESVVWDKNTKKIYSDDPIKSVNGSRITYGDGFESDESFKNPQIYRQRGTLQWNEE